MASPDCEISICVGGGLDEGYIYTKSVGGFIGRESWQVRVVYQAKTAAHFAIMKQARYFD